MSAKGSSEIGKRNVTDISFIRLRRINGIKLFGKVLTVLIGNVSNDRLCR